MEVKQHVEKKVKGYSDYTNSLCFEYIDKFFLNDKFMSVNINYGK